MENSVYGWDKDNHVIYTKVSNFILCQTKLKSVQEFCEVDRTNWSKDSVEVQRIILKYIRLKKCLRFALFTAKKATSSCNQGLDFGIYIWRLLIIALSAWDGVCCGHLMVNCRVHVVRSVFTLAVGNIDLSLIIRNRESRGLHFRVKLLPMFKIQFVVATDIIAYK